MEMAKQNRNRNNIAMEQRLTLNSVNLNATVFVELTDFGWNTIREYYQRLWGCEDVEKCLDAHRRNTHTYVGGEPIMERKLTEIQLHEVANMLGAKMYVGEEPCIVGNQIYFMPENQFWKREEKDT